MVEVGAGVWEIRGYRLKVRRPLAITNLNLLALCKQTAVTAVSSGEGRVESVHPMRHAFGDGGQISNA